jgi:hypothetical protein
MSSLDAEMRRLNKSMTLSCIRLLGTGLLVLVLPGCGDRGNAGDSARETLPPVFPLGPSSNTNWDIDAGPVMLVSIGNSTDSAAVILPEITDSTIASVQRNTAPVSGLTFDLFGRGGKVGSSTTAVTALESADSTQACDAWPLVRVRAVGAGWRVGFAKGHVQPIKLDSIEAMPSTDSAALAASLAQTAATLPLASDPTFRGLPFRVRSALTFRLDSVDVVIADVVRIVNEEANPRLEHLLIIGERSVGTMGKYTVGYYSRTAGAEETTQASEVLTAVRVGPSRRPAVIVNIEYDDGRKLGLIERTTLGQWRSIWRSAYTDC